MTAPSAARPPLPAGPTARAKPRSRRARRTRRLAAAASVLLLASAATGCVRVDGRTALVPSATHAAASSALARFVRVSNEANTAFDPKLNPRVESGSMLAVDGSFIRQWHVMRPNGNPGYVPLSVSDPHFLIPRQVGWPKWFAVDTATNRGSRWILVFTHASPQQPWTASYLLLMGKRPDPDFATDAHGYAEPVPLAGTGLAVQPGALPAAYAAYVHGGEGASAFAPGPYTTDARSTRVARTKPHPGLATQYADEAGDTKRYGPLALRLKDGGALVFFTTQFQWKATVAGGLSVKPPVTAMLTSPVHTSVTQYYVSMQGAIVPPAGGKVDVGPQTSQLIEAHGS